MTEICKIVVPVDFTEATESLVEYAVYMAGKLSAVVHFVHVFNFSNFTNFYAGDAMLGSPYYRKYEDQLLSEVKEKMTELAKDNSTRCQGCTGAVISGDPVDEIIEYAEKKDSDLIIVSAHGAKGWEKILLGSVAGRIVNRAHCPVLTMNPFKDPGCLGHEKEGKTGQDKNKEVFMELKEDFMKLVEKLKAERDKINLKIHLGSMDAQNEFEEAEKKWGQLKGKASELVDDGKTSSEEFISKAKIVGEELKETYKRLSDRL